MPTAFNKLKELYKVWGTPLCLKDIGVKESDIERIVEIERGHSAGMAKSRLWQLTADDVRTVLKAAL